jgi:hypothetical protein
MKRAQGKQSLEVVEGLLITSSSEVRDPRVEWLYHQIAQLKDVDRSVPTPSPTATASVLD